MNSLIGGIIIGIGVLFMLFGVIGILKNKVFFNRILLTSKIDTVGAVTVIIGVAVKHGWSFFSLKAMLLMGIIMITNPLAAHIMTRSAYDRDNDKGGDV
jgi:multicomponent Na+:H+ antiporter subunit G